MVTATQREQVTTKPASVEEAVFGILKHVDFTKNIVDALDVGSPPGLSASAREGRRQAEFLGLVRRVAVDVSTHPRRNILFQLMRDDSKISDHEVIDLFNFIYFYLVNQFKGELAELLARPLLHEFMAVLVKSGRAPADINLVPGSQIVVRRVRHGIVQPGWHKGADALLVTTTDRLARWQPLAPGTELSRDGYAVVAAAEIKSYRASRRNMFAQIANHVHRLRLGACLSGVEIDSTTAVVLVLRRGGGVGCVPMRARIPVARFARLAVRPSLANRSARPLEQWGPQAWVAELQPSAADLSEAGYRFTDWFLGQAGAVVFGPPGTVGPLASMERISNPWPHMTLEEAGRNRLREAMYSLARREVFQGSSGRASQRTRRARTTFRWLYNALCYGYERASGDRLHWPEDHPELPRISSGQSPAAEGQGSAAPRRCDPAEPLVKKIRRAYANGKLSDARRLLGAAKRRYPTLQRTRHVAWLEGMISFREGRFANALARFPGPESGNRDFWWTRDMVMLARLHARTGHGSNARSILAKLEPLDQWPYRALPVELHAVAALAWLADHNQREATREVECGIQLLKELRDECRLHKERGWGEPLQVNAATVQMAVLDLAAVLAATGRTVEAVNELTQLGDLDGWEFTYIARDPLLAPLRADSKARRQLARWRTAEQRC